MPRRFGHMQRAKKIEFRPKKTASSYGSTDEWFACDNPDFHHNFEYRVKRDVKS
jgi:hypothetical protein